MEGQAANASQKRNSKLIFVYNTKSDFLSEAMGIAHKIISPSTYQCSLCALTHDNFGAKKKWKSFVKSFSIPMEFYHIEDFEKKFKTSLNYPVVLEENEGTLKQVLTKEDLNEISNVDELIRKLEF